MGVMYTPSIPELPGYFGHLGRDWPRPQPPLPWRYQDPMHALAVAIAWGVPPNALGALLSWVVK
jgi:hypothetical protein